MAFNFFPTTKYSLKGFQYFFAFKATAVCNAVIAVN